jgi:hypothetical protein
MKILISESQTRKFFDSFIERYHPELLSLDADPIYANEVGKVYGYEFVNDIYLYFTYRSKPVDKFSPNADEFPTLRVSTKLYETLIGMFGKFHEHLIKDWFEEHYNLPVKTIKSPSDF